MLLLGSAYAYSQKEHVANEVAALESLIDTMESPTSNAIFAQMVERKEELQYLAAKHPEHNQRYAAELSSLASMVDSVEQKNFNEVLTLISQRKDSLVKDLTHLKEDKEEKPKKEEKADKEADEKKSTEDYEKEYKKYQEKLLAFYKSIPDDAAGKALIAKINASAQKFKAANKKYEKKAGKPLDPMGPEDFKHHLEGVQEEFPLTTKAIADEKKAASKDPKEDKEEKDPKEKEEKEPKEPSEDKEDEDKETKDEDKETKDEDKETKDEDEEVVEEEEELMIFAEKTDLEKEEENEKNTVRELVELQEAGTAFEKLVDGSFMELAMSYERVMFWYPYKTSGKSAPDADAEQAFED